MTEEELAIIEADHAEHCPITQIDSGDAYIRQIERAVQLDGDHCDIVVLLAAVRGAQHAAREFDRLRRVYGDEILRLREREKVLKRAACHWVNIAGRDNVTSDLLEAIV